MCSDVERICITITNAPQKKDFEFSFVDNKEFRLGYFGKNIFRWISRRCDWFVCI